MWHFFNSKLAQCALIIIFFVCIAISKVRYDRLADQISSVQSRNERSVNELFQQKAKFARSKKAPSLFDEDLDLSDKSDHYLEDLVDRTLTLAGNLDEKARYKLFPDTFVAEKYIKLSGEPLCVALQSTLNLAPSLHRYQQNWPGGISFALFTPSHLFYVAVVYIKHLRKCHPKVKNQVTWHLSHPNLLPPPSNLKYLLRMDFNCSYNDKQVLLGMELAINPKDKVLPEDLLYPQNTMRNMARRHCKSRWVMCPDVDMVFPDAQHDGAQYSYYTRLNTFLKNESRENCKKCAYVLPLYEVEDLGFNRVPKSKRELLQYVANKSAQIYHSVTFPGNQRSSNLSVWEQMPLIEEIQEAFPINYTWWYEPVYIAQHGSPPFDERFIGYGLTRNSQALEMYLSNFTFHLLDTVFVCHLWGLKKRDCDSTSHMNMFRRNQVIFNSKMFYTHFTREVALSYDRDLGDLINITAFDKRFKKYQAVDIHVNNVDNACHPLFRV